MKLRILLTCFPFLLLFQTTFGQKHTFSDINFELSESAFSLFEIELKNFQKQIQPESIRYFFAFLPHLELLLDQAGLSDDFKYLMLFPVSSAGGDSHNYWSLSEKQAIDLGLNINDFVDERKHISLSSSVVIHKIKSDFSESGDPLVTLYKLWMDSGWVANIPVFNEEKRGLPLLNPYQHKELIRFLAFKTFMENQGQLNPDLHNFVFYAYSDVKNKTLGDLADELNLDIMEIIACNNWLSAGKVPEGYKIMLFLPLNRYDEISLKDIDKGKRTTGFPVLTENPKLQKGLGGTFYTINGLSGIMAESGDNFALLAYYSDIKPGTFLKFNDLSPNDALEPGRVYYLTKKPDKAPIPYHVAQAGDTWWSIAQDYGVKLKKLLNYNHLQKISRLEKGQLVWLRTKRDARLPVQIIPDEEEVPEPNLFEKVEPITAHEISISYEDESNGYESEEIHIIAGNQNDFYVPENLVRKVASPLVSYQVTSNNLPLSETKESIKTPQKKFMVHSVKRGDTLSEIAEKYNVSLKQLFDLNNLISDTIEVGDKIIVKKL